MVSSWFYMVSMRLRVVSMVCQCCSGFSGTVSGPTSVVSAVLSRPNATPLPIVCWHQISILKACESSETIFGALNIVYLLVGVALA